MYENDFTCAEGQYMYVKLVVGSRAHRNLWECSRAWLVCSHEVFDEK